MIAWIDGVMVNGTPEEIQKFREINAETKTTTKMYDDIPDHVKKYGEGSVTYKSTGQKHRMWY